jgi:hypothetical protein
MGWLVHGAPQPFYRWERNQSRIVQEAVGAPKMVWTCGDKSPEILEEDFLKSDD